VSDHRRPDKADAVMTSMKLPLVELWRKYPLNTNSASVATIRITPTVITAITAMSLISGFSKRNKNAKTKTNASVDDLHKANINSYWMLEYCRMQE
jgi:hypothetical protein